MKRYKDEKEHLEGMRNKDKQKHEQEITILEDKLNKAGQRER